jgi:RimJ/RimL family protein N-acetyltransferase
MKEIETSRLRLRPGDDGDIDGLCAGLNDWSVAQWLVRPPYPYERHHAESFIALTQRSDRSGFHPFRIVAARDTNLLLGVISLEPSGDRAELGYWLLPSAHGRGYMVDAAVAMLSEGAAQLPEVSVVYATTDPDNLRSQAVLSRLAFKRVGQQPRRGEGRRPSPISLLFERSLRPDGEGA